MEFWGFTSPGLEKIALRESVIFNIKSIELGRGIVGLSGDLEKCSKMRSLLALVRPISFADTFQGLFENNKSIDFLTQKGFRLEFVPRDHRLEQQLGGIIWEASKKRGIKTWVNLTTPEVRLVCQFDGNLYRLGEWLHSPENPRRVFVTRHSLSRTSAFALGFAGVQGVKQSSLFLVTEDGLPIIEAALHLRALKSEIKIAAAGLNNVLLRGARKNAMAAGVHKEVEWLEGGTEGLERFERIALALHFKRDSTGLSGLQVFQSIKAKVRGGIVLIVLGEQVEEFLKTRETGPYRITPFMQGGLSLALLEFSTPYAHG